MVTVKVYTQYEGIEKSRTWRVPRRLQVLYFYKMYFYLTPSFSLALISTITRLSNVALINFFPPVFFNLVLYFSR